jgi:hypothetical protein
VLKTFAIAIATARVAVILGATCLVALVAIIQAGPADDEASVIVTLINHSATTVVVDHFDLPTRLPGQHGYRPWRTRSIMPGREGFFQLPNRVEFAPGQHEVHIAWRTDSESDWYVEPLTSRNRIKYFEPINRKTCFLDILITDTSVDVSPCGHPFPRAWIDLKID